MIGFAVKQGVRALAAAAILAFAGPAVAEVAMGDDGLHKPDWLKETFLDLREDLADANAEGKRMLIIVEQRGCIYCTRMHEKVFPDPDIDAIIRESFFVVQINLYGDLEVTDFDGTVLTEKDTARRWNTVFTPTMIFLPEEVPEDDHGGSCRFGRDARRVRAQHDARDVHLGARQGIREHRVPTLLCGKLLCCRMTWAKKAGVAPGAGRHFHANNQIFLLFDCGRGCYSPDSGSARQ